MKVQRKAAVAVVLFLVCFACGALRPSPAAADIWYVDFARPVPGAGASWGDEFNRLQQAVDASADGDEVWVKDVNPNPRPDGFDYYNIVFNVPVVRVDKAIGIYGGFVGTETERSQRDWVTNEIIISGGGIATHIFEISASATIDGFTIRDSHAYNFLPADNPNNYGGGFYIKSPAGEHIQVIVQNCRMTNHQADLGGAMYIEEASVAVENCTVDNNTANQYPAGISYNVSGLANAAFTLRGSTVSNNRSYGGGSGGLQLAGGFSNPGVVITVEDSIIDGNASPAGNGGGIYGYAQGSGSMMNISNSRITGNSAGSNGGGMYIFANTTVVNTLVAGNSAGFDGGGIYLSGNVALQNVTVVDNSATVAAGFTRGGGISFAAGGTADNTIVWGNTSAGSFDNATSLTAFSHSSVDISDITDPAELAAFNDAAKKNASTAPTFADAPGGNYRIVSGSVGVDGGDNAAAGGLDLDGKPRFIDDPATTDGGSGAAPVVDMGAYEFGTAPADYDGDGIENDVDGYFTGGVFISESAVSSDNFTDRDAGGVTEGVLTDRSDQTMTVQDSAAGADGVDVAAAGGSGTATVTACGYGIAFTAGDDVTVTCGSLTAAVTTGPVTIQVASDITVDVPSGTTTTISATATGWDVACSGGGTVSVQHPGGTDNLTDGQSTSVVSAFAEMTMTVAPFGGGTTTPTGTSDVMKGAGQAITATAAGGVRFASWTAFPAANGAFGNSGEASTTVTLSGDATVRANFVEQVSLTMVENPDAGGDTSPAPGTALVDRDVAQAISTTVSAGYQFQGWTASPDSSATFGNSSALTTTVTLSGDAAVTANYAQVFPLNVIVAGNGVVTSAPPGIDCGVDCTELYTSGTAVTLTPSAGAGSTFSEWSGDDDCSDGMVTMSADLTCTATFTLNQYTVTASAGGAGAGTVISDVGGISYTYPLDSTGTTTGLDHGSSITVTATAATGSTVSWSGCAATGGTAPAATCTFSSLDGDKAVTATFTPDTFTLTVAMTGGGGGTVTSTPAGIDCGADCTESFANGAAVTLTADPALRSLFAGWSGDADCSDGSVTMNTDVSCTAGFSVLGDWNIDGTPDMVWRNPDTGMNALLYLKANAKSGIDFIVSAPTDWELAAAADLDDDGLMDLIFRNRVTGLHIVAYFDGKTYRGFKAIPFKKDPWKLCGTGDHNNDGKPDLFWTNPTTGENEVVYLVAGAEVGSDSLPKAPLPWKVVAIDDFNGDGVLDLVARNGATGMLAAGYLDGTNLDGVGIMPTAPLSQEVCGTMDLNLDGKPDIVLRDPVTGKNEAWYMDGTKRTETMKLPTAPPPWSGMTGYK